MVRYGQSGAGKSYSVVGYPPNIGIIPRCCQSLWGMIDKNDDLAALQQLAYDGTPEEVCRNFKDHAFTALDKVVKKHTKSGQHDKVECERALHFFNEAFNSGWKEY